MDVTNLCLRCTQLIICRHFLFPKSSHGIYVYVIQETKLPLSGFHIMNLVMRNKSLQADSAKLSHIQKQSQIFYNREKNNLSVNNIQSLHTKKQEFYNSGFETNLLNCKTCECGSSWEEALRQSYDLWLQWRESVREREISQEGEGPDSINCFYEYVRRGGRVRAMKINHYPLEN